MLRISTRLLAVAAWLSLFLPCPSRLLAAAPNPALRPSLSTDRGCLETGHRATFEVGDSILIFLRVGSATVPQASTVIASAKPNSVTTVLVLGSLPTNATFGFAGRVGAPVGLHRLTLKATGGGVTARRSCTFHVVDSRTPASPQPSRTPTATPSPTRTPTINLTPTATSGGSLRPRVTTNRGCEETGQQPSFRVGEHVVISFETASTRASYATVSLRDTLPNGRVNVFQFGNLATNQTYTFRAAIAPPTGRESLRLRASAFGQSAESERCSFAVVP